MRHSVLVLSGLGMLLSPVAHAQEAPPSADALALPQLRWPKGIAGAGDRIWIAAGNEGLIELGPGAEPRRITGPREAVAIGASSSGVVVVADRDRHLHRIEGATWTRGPQLPEGRFGDDVFGIVVADDGTVHAATTLGGVSVWDGRRVRTVPYGEGEHRAHGLALAGDRVFVSGNDRLLLEIRGQRAARPSFAAAAEQALEAGYQTFGALWVSPTTGHLWIGTNARRVLEVDLASSAVTVHDTDLFGQTSVITGFVANGVETIVLGAQSDLATLRGSTRGTIPGRFSFPEALYAHAASDTLYVVNRDGVHALALSSGEPRATRTAAVESAPSTAASAPADSAGSTPSRDASARPTSRGIRLEDLRLTNCDAIGAMVIVAGVQSAAESCLRSGQASITLSVRGSRVRAVGVEAPGTARACLQRRLRQLRAPIPQCDVELRAVREGEVD